MYEVLNYETWQREINELEYLIKNKSMRFSITESKKEKSFYFDDIKFMYLDKIKNIFYVKDDGMFDDLFNSLEEFIEDILDVNVNNDHILFKEYMVEYLKLYNKEVRIVIINRYGERNTDYLKNDEDDYIKAVKTLWMNRKLKRTLTVNKNESKKQLIKI